MSFWKTDDQVDALKKFWAAGLSAEQIARQMGAATRNVIIGKANRLGLPARAPCRVATRKKSARTMHLDHVPPASPRSHDVNNLERQVLGVNYRPGHSWSRQMRENAWKSPPPPPAEYDVARVKTLDLELHHCRWPVGDPQDANFGHCGCKPMIGKPYCKDHVRRAYGPSEASGLATPRRSAITNSFVGLRRSFVTEDA